MFFHEFSKVLILQICHHLVQSINLWKQMTSICQCQMKRVNNNINIFYCRINAAALFVYLTETVPHFTSKYNYITTSNLNVTSQRKVLKTTWCSKDLQILYLFSLLLYCIKDADYNIAVPSAIQYLTHCF